MRGDVTLTARLLLRGTGLAGLTAAAGGVLAIVAVTRPWYLAVARLEMLGEDQTRPVESVPGLPTVPWAWLAFVAGLVALGVGLAVAIDRPFPRSRSVLLGATVVLAGAGIAALTGPVDAAAITGQEARELLALSDELPVGVAVEVSAARGAGIQLTLVAAALVAVGAAAARES